MPTTNPHAPARSNLPEQLTSFIGRERELAAVTEALRHARLLTLTGAGGCGKTRLALTVAQAAQHAYADGVVLVELAALATPSLVPHAIAAALHRREEPRRTVLETLQEALHHRHLLLLLDNCEHLVDACALVAETLLQACPRLAILATSREDLGVAGETVWRVPSLSLPPVSLAPRSDLLAAAGRSEAVQLFVQRAAAVQPGFALMPEHARAIAAICRGLDGMPLAIELAAARTKVLSVEQIEARLSDRFRVLVGGSRTAQPRQQTLRATIDWSHDLLDEQERLLFRRLAVFAGGWTIEAIEAVCAGAGIATEDVLELVAHLLDKSLILAEASGAQLRYRFLETIRQYAIARLDEADETAELRRRHAGYYMELARTAGPHLWGPQQPRWLNQLELDHDNLRAALRFVLVSGRTADALRAGAALGRFWQLHGHLREGRAWLDQALAEDTASDAATRAEALVATGVMAWAQGDYAGAATLHASSLEIFRRLGDKQGIARALIRLGIQAAAQGDWQKAADLFQEGLIYAREVGDRSESARALTHLGITARIEGDDERGQALLEESLALLRAAGERRAMMLPLAPLAALASARGDLVAVRGYLEELLAIGVDVGDDTVVATGLTVGARLCGALYEPARAASLLAAAESLRVAIAAGVERNDQREFDAIVAAVRAALSASAFDEAWAAGAGMTREEAIACALAPVQIAEIAVPSAAGQPSRQAPRSDSLTPREVEVLGLLAAGHTSALIAAQLVLSERTVHRHLANIYAKVGARGRADAVAYAVRHGLAGT